MRAYPLDLRKRAVAAVLAGRSCRAAASDFGVSTGCVVKWVQRYRATGSAAAFPVGGGHWALAGERDWLLGRVAETPDVTLRQLQAELADRGIKVSYYAVWHFCAHEGIRKPVRRRKGSPRRRKATGTTRKRTSNRKRRQSHKLG